ncbi:MAG: hypothetical protein LBE56_00610 [Tannerella sp.]|jgi:hypothetical protein|nr:hypothetical protein [Tannerella sp.]
MKQIKNYLIILAAFGCMLLAGCEKDGDKQTDFTDEEIEALYQEIEPLADEILLSDKPDWNEIVEQYKNRKEIKEIESNEDGLMIEFINGQINGWILPPPVVSDEILSSIDLTHLSNALQKQTSIRNTAQDEKKPKIAFVNSNWYIDKYYQKFILDMAIPDFQKTWDVEEIGGKNGANLDFFKKRLSEFDVVFLHAHGAIALNGKFWIETGEEANTNFWTNIKANIGMGKIAAINQKDYIDNKEVITTHAFISGEVISDNYLNNPFPNSLIYLTSCHGLQNPNQFAKHFTDNGAKVVVGWNETNCIGILSGAKLLDGLMLSENLNLSDAVANLPEKDRINDHRNNSARNPLCNPPNSHYAELVFYPSSAGNYKLPYVDDGLTDEIHNIIPDEILEKFKGLDIVINGGNNPPNITGSYFISPLIITKTNFNGSTSLGRMNMDLTFSEQNNTNLTVKVDYTKRYLDSGTFLGGDGLGAFITGEGNKFSVFFEANGTSRGGPYKSVEIMSGEITSEGIKNWQRAYIMTQESSATIKVGQGRLNIDSDGFSERTTGGTQPNWPDNVVGSIDFDFGNVTVNQSASENLNISNSGNSILYWSTVCPDGFRVDSWSGASGSIEPGKQAKIELIFRPTVRKYYSGTVIFYTSIGKYLINVSGTGK